MEQSNENFNETEKITTWGYASFFVTLTKSSFIGMSSYVIFSICNINAYIATILGGIIGIIPLLIFIFISKNSKNYNIIELNNELFGKVIGAFLNCILNITIIFMAILALYNVSEFIDINYMPDTNTNYLRILLLMPVVYAASKKSNVITKISTMVLIINLGIFIVSALGLVANCNVDNMFPILKDGIKPVIKASILYMIFSTFPVFLLLIIPKDQIGQKGKYSKVCIMFFGANLMITIVTLFTILILGEELIPLFRFPEYISLKSFKLFTIIERVENTLSLRFIFNVIMYLIISFHFLIQSFKTILKNNNTKIKVSKVSPYILAILVLVLSNIIFKNAIFTTEFIVKVVPYILIFGIFLPMMITFLGVVIKNIKEKVKCKSKSMYKTSSNNIY